MTLSKSDTQHNNALPLCWVSHFIYCYAECHYAECHSAWCRYAESRGAKLTDWGKHARLLEYGINYKIRNLNWSVTFLDDFIYCFLSTNIHSSKFEKIWTWSLYKELSKIVLLECSTIYLEGFEQSYFNYCFVQGLMHISKLLPRLRHLVVKPVYERLVVLWCHSLFLIHCI